MTGVDGEKVVTLGWKTARDADKAVRELESINVFYVAMTRARDLVVLSGTKTRRVNGWMKRSEGFLSGASEALLRRRMFSEVPEVCRQEPGAVILEEAVQFQPLEVPRGVERKSVTSLCVNKPLIGSGQSAIANPARYGTVGHAVLEELANNGWSGDIPRLVELFCAEHGLVEIELLVPQLEAACRVLREETAGAELLLAEHSFVLKREELILDGTLDLLAGFSGRWRILDYKFSNDSPEAVLETYGPQLAAYMEAVGKLNPGDDVSAALVLIGESVQIVSEGER